MGRGTKEVRDVDGSSPPLLPTPSNHPGSCLDNEVSKDLVGGTMPPINPRHSRPLDVHRWSDHPEVNGLVGEVWDRIFQGEQEGSKPGPKPKARPRDMLKVVLLDLYVAWKTDPELSIGVDLNLRKWVTGSRYNALHLSRAVPGIIHRLEDVGLIDLSVGSYAGPGASTNRTARIRAAEPLRAKFREARFERRRPGRTERRGEATGPRAGEWEGPLAGTPVARM